MSSTAPRLEPDAALESVLKLWTDFNSSLVPKEIFQKACKAAIDLLGADHSTFVQFDKTCQTGYVCAEDFSDEMRSLPNLPVAQGMPIPLAGVSEEEPLLYGDGLICCDDVAALNDGTFKRNLLWMGVQSILIVRVKWKDSLLGSFSFDSISHKRKFRDRDIQLMRLMAEAIAQALGNALVYERERYRSELLKRLDATTGELRNAGNEMQLRANILKTALRLSQWSAGALFRYSGDQRELHLVVGSSGLPENALPRTGQKLVTSKSGSWIWQQIFEQPSPKPRVTSRPENLELFASDSLFQPFERAVALPIRRFGDLDSVLLLLDNAPERKWQEDEVEYLIEFSSRATTATERQAWWDEVGDTLVQQFSLLFSQSPRSEQDLNQMLYHFLTMATAGFGLKFNRAAVFLLDEGRKQLEVHFAIGQFEKEQWHERCKSDGERESDQFDKWVQQPYGLHSATEMEVWAREQGPFELNDPANEVLREGLDSNYILLKDSCELERLPSRLRDKWRHTSPVVLARLSDGMEPVGLMIADKEWTERHIGAKDLHLLQIFCKEAARGVATYRQRLRIPEINSKFDLISKIKADPIFAGLEEPQVVQRITEAISKAFGDTAVGVLYVNQNGVWNSHFVNAPAWAGSIDVFDRNEIGDRVMQSREVEVLEEGRVKTELREHGIRGMTFLPLWREERGIGVMVALHTDPFAHRRVDQSTLQRYAGLASEIYDSWSTVHFLRDLQSTMEEITFQIARRKAPRQMAEAAQRLFDAKTVTFWSYDSVTNEFLPIPECLGFDDELPKPSDKGMTHRILNELEYYPIGDVRTSLQKLHPKTVEFLRKYDQHSVQGIAIGSPNKRLGVLYLTYGQPRDFTLGARVNLESFARNVAVVLESAQAFESGRHMLEATQEVGRVLARGNKRQALESVAARTLSSVRCHSVTIFALNHFGYPDFPPVIEGVDRDLVEQDDREDSTRLVRKLIASGEMTIARNAAEVRRVFMSKFSERELIQTTFAIPLHFQSVDVGLMFASFRKELPEHEVEPVQSLLNLFANQAAVAIGNANRFRDLGDLSARLLKKGESEGVLNIAMEFIQSELRPSHCVFVLREKSQLRVIKQAGWPEDLFQEIVEGDSHAAFTVRKKEPNRFSTLKELRESPLFEGLHPPERLIHAGIASGLGIPLFFSEDVRGALLLHSTSEQRFEEEDVSYASLIANQAMAALRSVSMLRRVKAQYEVAKIAAEYGPTTKAIDILRSIAKVCLDSLADGANNLKASAASIELYDLKIPAITEGHDSSNAVLAMNKPLFDGKQHVGQIAIWSEGNRGFDEDDKHLVDNVAALLVMFAKQVREQQRVLTNLAFTTHEYERCSASLQYVNMLVDGVVTDFPPHHRAALLDLRDALLRFDDHHRTMSHTVQVLTGTLSAALELSKLPRLYDLLETAVHRFSDRAAALQVKIALPDRDSLSQNIQLRIDPELLSTVLNNLIGNALKFAGRGTTVDCAILHRGRNVLLEIADQGPGISAEAQRKIFDLWFQAKEHKSEQAPGFGVGLFISKEIAELHGAKILIESAEGRGSRFQVQLPVYD